MRSHWLILYDRAETILWLEPDPVPPWTRASVIGRRASDTVLSGDRPLCLAAFARLWQTGQPQDWDTGHHEAGRWRTRLQIVSGFPPIAAVGLTRPFPRGIERLTASERIICRLLAQGWASKQVGVKLGVARSTIDNRRAGIAQKLGVHPHGLVAWCGEHAEWLV